MSVITIQAPAEDTVFFENLRKQGTEVEVFKLNRFEGLSEIVQVTVTLTAAVTPLLIAYFKEQTARAKNRKIIVDGRKIQAQGLSEEALLKIVASAK